MLDTTGGALHEQGTDVRPALSTWLRGQTSVEHVAIEGLLDLDRPLAAAEAVQVLEGWAALWRDVRAAARSAGGSATAARELAPMADQALAWLAADLGGLAARARHPVDGALPCLTALLADDAAAWGVAYVLRGFRLGGVVLAPRVDAALEPLTGRASAFLGTTGAEPGREWVACRRRLDGSGARPSGAVTAARWTFCWVAAGLSVADPRSSEVGRR